MGEVVTRGRASMFSLSFTNNRYGIYPLGRLSLTASDVNAELNCI